MSENLIPTATQVMAVFIQSEESVEPWCYCGKANDDPYELAKAIGLYVQSEIESAVHCKEDNLSFNIKLKEMTEDEIAAIPEL